jgi:hypothetical protein
MGQLRATLTEEVDYGDSLQRLHVLVELIDLTPLLLQHGLLLLDQAREPSSCPAGWVTALPHLDLRNP